MRVPAIEGARLAFEASLARLRRSTHDGSVSGGRDGDESDDWIAVRNRIEKHARDILAAVAEFDHYRTYYHETCRVTP